MGDFFDVDLDVLNRFTSSLRNATSMMESALNAMQDASTFEIGSWALDEAADEFQHTWRYGLGKLKDLTSDMAEKMQASYDDYNQIESTLVKGFDKLVADFQAAAG